MIWIEWIELKLKLNCIELRWDELNWIEMIRGWKNEGMNWMNWTDLNWTELNWTNEFSKRKSRTKASFPHLQLFTFWGESRTKAEFSQLPRSLFEGSLARKLSSHIFHFHFLREVSHESWVLTSSTFKFWRKPRTKASFLHLPLSLFEGCLARKLCSHIFHFHFWREVSHESFICTSLTVGIWG